MLRYSSRIPRPLLIRIAKKLRSGTTVLVKGSRFMRMERVVAALCGPAATERAH